MRYIVEKNFVQVIGAIWMPAITCAMEYPLADYDLETMRDEESGEITREDIEQWLTTHSGDFQGIDDFRASIGETEYPWTHEESEWTYNECVYGNEE